MAWAELILERLQALTARRDSAEALTTTADLRMGEGKHSSVRICARCAPPARSPCTCAPTNLREATVGRATEDLRMDARRKVD